MGKLSTCFYLFTKCAHVIQSHIQLKITSHQQRGNLQDAINANVVNRKQFSEREMLLLFKGTCEAVSAMHHFRVPISATKQSQSNGTSSRQQRGTAERHSEDDERFPHPEGDGDDGYSYGSAVNVPLVTKHRMEEEGDVIYDGDEELAQLEQNGKVDEAGRNELLPYAHRDLKPG
jgi:serine/threonine kinase 16